MERINFKVGDYVKIKIPQSQDIIIGKIEEVFEEGGDKLIRYNEFFFPEKTSSN